MLARSFIYKYHFDLIKLKAYIFRQLPPRLSTMHFYRKDSCTSACLLSFLVLKLLDLFKRAHMSLHPLRRLDTRLNSQQHLLISSKYDQQRQI